jgi:hypothetical protein
VTRIAALPALALALVIAACAQTSFVPMDPGDKMEYGMKAAVRPTDFFQTALGSGIAQWRNAPYEWGQGWDAYGERYASRFAQHLVKRSITSAIQMADGEDPRRIRSERRGLRNRAVDSVKYSFVAQRDDGTRGFAYSRVAGSYAGAFISRQWHPARQHTFTAGVAAGTISLGVEVGMSVLNEFMPDILRKLRHR